MSLIYSPLLPTSKVLLHHLVQEQSSQYIDHDQLFKQLIETFFEEFLEGFFPQVHEHIDFEHVTFLSEEFFTEAFDGDKKILDLAVEVKMKETEALIVVHIEPQSYKQPDFNERMFQYFSLLYNKVKKPILPIALFSYESDWEKNAFIMRVLDFDILHFQYLTLHLRKQNWRTFIKKNNPVAGALLSKMGFSDDERVQVKLEFFQILSRLKLDREKASLLLGFFETYLTLTEDEEGIFVKEAKKLDNAEEILELPISYEERGKKIGKEIGKKIGKEVGRIEERKRVARNMLQKGLDIQLIAETTMLSTKEIEVIIKELE